MSEAANRAVEHILKQVIRNPRLAHFIAPFSQSLELLTEARAEALGQDPQEFRRDFYPQIKTERPGCPNCSCDKCKEES